MKITVMKCPSCGANVDVHEEGGVKCAYCGQTFLAESEKPPKVHNTVINNYTYGEEEDYTYTNRRRYRNKKSTSMENTITGIVMIVLMVAFTIALYLIGSGVFSSKESFSPENPYRYSSDKKKAREYEKALEKMKEYDYISYDKETISVEATERETSPNEREWLEVGADESDISHIGKMNSLYTLIIHDASNITDYSVLKGAYSISRLTIRNAKSLKNADFLLSMDRLEYLDIEGSQISDLSMLKDKLSLMYLTLENNENISDYTFLESLTSLKKLRLRTAVDAKIPDLSKNKFLKSLIINGEIK